MTEIQFQPLLSAAEVADLLGMHRSHVVRLAAAGELPYEQRAGTGRTAAYLFRRVDVEHYAAEHLPVPPIHRQSTIDEAVAS
jgi:excisionase family DNA binding protein